MTLEPLVKVVLSASLYSTWGQKSTLEIVDQFRNGITTHLFYPYFDSFHPFSKLFRLKSKPVDHIITIY